MIRFIALAALLSANSFPVKADDWSQEEEIALARSAAPQAVTDHASFWTLGPEGYERRVEGTNGFNCLVLRRYSVIFDQQRDLWDWHGLTAPICYDAVASASGPMQEQLLRAKLGQAGADHDTVRDAVFAAYARGELPMLKGVAFGYMYSAAQRLTPQVGEWHPHLMIYGSGYSNAQLGGNGFMSGDPIVFEAPDTFRAVIAVPVGGRDDHIAPH